MIDLHSVDGNILFRLLAAALAPALALATVALGLATALIARQQSKTNRNQFRLALFTRRMKIFDSTMKFIAAVTTTAKATVSDLYHLAVGTQKSGFLFGPDIAEYRNELYKKGTELLRLEHPQEGENLGAKRMEIVNWFAAQFDGEARDRFGKYMDFKDVD